MTKSNGYEAPRAVRMSDAPTAQFQCVNGPTGNAEVCNTGAGVGGNVCTTGSYVRVRR